MASIHKKENGTYYVRYRENGQNKSKSGFRTKKDAHHWIMEMERGETRTSDVTYDRLVKEFLEYKKNVVRATTYINIRNMLRHWKFNRVSDITSLQIEEQFYALPIAYRTKRTALTALGTCLRFGKRKYGIPIVIDEVSVRNPDGETNVKEIITVDQLYQLIENDQRPMYKLLYKLLFLSGIRIGEASALTYDDIYDTYIDINKTLNNIRQVTKPKNKSSIRKVYLPKDFLQELKAFSGNSDKYLFATKEGTMIHGTQLCNQMRKKAARIGIKLTPHTFRHSCASYLISQGLPIPVVSKHLGHSSPAVTMSVYAHMIPSDDEKKIEILSKIFKK